MPFCKICFDLGRPDFEKHNVRDSARNTTCPYLLNTKCRNCGYFGHTSSYCKIPRHLNPVLKKPEVKHINIVKPCIKPKNAFEILCTEQDDLEVEKDDELPDITNVQWGKGLWKKSWADEVEEEEKKSRSWAKVVVA
tara:strand:- start:475 stop:885 length:411 start_codon:yes stop_codon:yes gene_type:complete